MENPVKICQSCGMPLHKDPNKGGTNPDKSKSEKFCGFCYQNGKFTDEGITLLEKIEKNVQLAIATTGISESNARQIAESIIPHLERWR